MPHITVPFIDVPVIAGPPDFNELAALEIKGQGRTVVVDKTKTPKEGDEVIFLDNDLARIAPYNGQKNVVGVVIADV